jgi:hypothetical protein
MLWTMSGLPVVYYAMALGAAVLRRRWRKAAWLVAGSWIAAVVVAVVLIGYDRLSMPVIEHYDWTGWHDAVYLGIYAVGVMGLLP